MTLEEKKTDDRTFSKRQRERQRETEREREKKENSWIFSSGRSK